MQCGHTGIDGLSERLLSVGLVRRFGSAAAIIPHGRRGAASIDGFNLHDNDPHVGQSGRAERWLSGSSYR